MIINIKIIMTIIKKKDDTNSWAWLGEGYLKNQMLYDCSPETVHQNL